jgi:hypothetical protein
MAFAIIQIAMVNIIKFSVSEINPSGTRLPPPTQAQFKVRFSMYTALITETAPIELTTSAAGAAIQVARPAIMQTPAPASTKG